MLNEGVASKDSRKAFLICVGLFGDQRLRGASVASVGSGAWYHVVNGGIERRLIFHGEAYHEKFEELLGLMVQQFGCGSIAMY